MGGGGVTAAPANLRKLGFALSVGSRDGSSCSVSQQETHHHAEATWPKQNFVSSRHPGVPRRMLGGQRAWRKKGKDDRPGRLAWKADEDEAGKDSSGVQRGGG